MSEIFKIALGQITVALNGKENLSQCETLMEKARND